jgi:hypothetical protein
MLLHFTEAIRSLLEGMRPLFEAIEALDVWLDPARRAFLLCFYTPLPDHAGELSSPPAAKRRRKRGRKAIDADHARLILMAQYIDAGLVAKRGPTAAVRQLPEFADYAPHVRDQLIDRLVGKYNDPEFQAELAQRRSNPDWRENIDRLRKSHTN